MSNTTGELIRKMRKHQGVTLEKLAQELKVSASAVSQYERGIISPSSETLIRIAQALKCPIREIASSEDIGGLQALFADAATLKIDTSGIPQEYIDELPDTTDADMQQLSLDLDSDFAALKKAYLSLNDRGKREAAARVQELAEIPRYQHESDSKNV